MELALEALGKQYGEVWALRDVTLRCGPGMLGLVGPNGAGKTTLMRIISTLLDQTVGHASWDGHDTRKEGEAVRRTLGYLPQDFGLYPELSARRFLRYIAAMKGIPPALAKRRVDELIEIVNLERAADRKLSGYSGGMKQRVGIAQALLNDPELLIVDEPTAGLDPEERVRFRTLLSSLTADRLIILSTHIIADVEAAATRLVLLKEGRIQSDTTPEALLDEASGQVWSVTVEADTARRLQAMYRVSGLLNSPRGLTLRLLSPVRPHETATPIEPSLEDAYLLRMDSHAPIRQ
ncbi:MAG TPA: ABC transporter ATP-binding protein [Chloroflexia bacterium]|nr:ABC transporter ATP-binding protein [Chloroflexia bacterium]